MYVVFTVATDFGEGYARIHFVTKKKKKAEKYCRENKEAEYRFTEII